jgi:hypothetical protein
MRSRTAARVAESRVTCTAGLPPQVCCVGRPWDVPDLAGQVAQWGEPLPQVVIDVAAAHGLNPHDLEWHVEAVDGFEPSDSGYAEAAGSAARHILAGGCTDSNPTVTERAQ